MEQRRIVLNQQLVNYYYWKPKQPSPQTIIFLHGWRSSALVWKPVIERVSEQTNFQIYALDFSGFGQSELPKRTFTLLDYSNLLKDFIQKLDLRNVCLVGHSFGGRVAIKLASVNRDFPSKLVLVDSAGFKIRSTRNRIFRVLAKIVKPVFRLPGLRGFRAKIYQSLGAEDYVATPQTRETFVNIVNEDLTALLPLIRQETLIFWGENDTVTPLMFALVFKENIKNSQLITIADAGHFCFLDQTEKFTAYLVKFLNQS